MPMTSAQAGGVATATVNAMSSIVGTITSQVAASRAQRTAEAQRMAAGQAYLTEAAQYGATHGALSSIPWAGIGLGVLAGGGMLALVLSRRKRRKR
jgi:hypothetical protein